ncbi:MAG: glycosyl hydrolase [FCB group bacterium]
MKKIILLLFILLNFTNIQAGGGDGYEQSYFLKTSKPYTRWWWFASVIKEEDIKYQLDWLKKNNFGGVEIAWVYPLNRMQKDTINYTPRQAWLSPEWSKVVSYAKRYADTLGLGCDFTFGTLWPFGDSHVSRDDASRVWEDSSIRQDIRVSWEYPIKGLVINHLDNNAFARYAKRMDEALKDAVKGNTSSLFCDSWEVETKTLWTPGFNELFQKKFGYDIAKSLDSLWVKGYERQRYDYFKLISEMVLDEFYKPFIQNAHDLKALARTQCCGAPVDIIKAYGLMDIPETEAMLYEPNFSRVVASAACLSKKKVITSETFTCLYGWPREHMGEEQTADLKLVCDALFANGTNHIIWHGTPFNPKGIDTINFYASVHVGSKGSLTAELPAFNSYMEKVSKIMKSGKTYSDVAVYLPLEDSWVAGDYPPELQMKWSWGQYELRYVKIPDELKGFHPLWVNNDFLKQGKLSKVKLVIGDAEFKSLYIDADYLDYEVLQTVYSLAKNGFPICIKHTPKEPGYNKHKDYDLLYNKVSAMKNVSSDFSKINKSIPLLQGEKLPDYWCKSTGNELYIYFSNPTAQDLHYPIKYGQSLTKNNIEKAIIMNAFGKKYNVNLVFNPYQSILMKITKDGKISSENIEFKPKEPEVR